MFAGEVSRNQIGTRSTGTLHTSAKERLTSVAIRIWIRDPDRHQNLIICSLAHCQRSLKIYANLFESFCAKLLTDRQRNDDYISSLAEVPVIRKF